ncbi:MAG: HIRAN domain-containing protein [Clostridia bacterium]
MSFSGSPLPFSGLGGNGGGSDFTERLSNDFAYDSVMGTNMTGFSSGNDGSVDFGSDDGFDNCCFPDDDIDDDPYFHSSFGYYDSDGDGHEENEHAGNESPHQNSGFMPRANKSSPNVNPTKCKDIGLGIMKHFPLIAENFSLYEFGDAPDTFSKLYSVDKKAAAECWEWVIDTYLEELNFDSDHTVDKYNYLDYIPDEMFDSDYRSDEHFLYYFIAEKPGLLKKLFLESYCEPLWCSRYQFLGFCIIHDDVENFKTACEYLLKNKLCSPCVTKDYVIETALNYRRRYAKESSSARFYTYLKNEAESLGKPLKAKIILKLMDEKCWGQPAFIKPQAVIPVPIKPAEEETPPAEVQKVSAKPKLPEFEFDELLSERSALAAKLEAVDKKIAGLQPRKTKPENESDVFIASALIVGTKYCDPDAVSSVEPEEKLELCREPDNEFDKNAIMVLDALGRKTGYLSRKDNIPIAKKLDEGQIIYAKAVSVFANRGEPAISAELWEEK